METALVMLGGGAFALGVLTHRLFRDDKRARLAAQLADLEQYIEKQQERIDRALRGERDALNRLEIVEARESQWATRLLAMRDQMEARP